MYFHMHVGSVFHSCVEAKFPQALGECKFPSSCNGFVCIFKGMWGVCVPQLCGRACVHFHRHVGSVFHSCVYFYR